MEILMDIHAIKQRSRNRIRGKLFNLFIYMVLPTLFVNYINVSFQVDQNSSGAEVTIISAISIACIVLAVTLEILTAHLSRIIYTEPAIITLADAKDAFTKENFWHTWMTALKRTLYILLWMLVPIIGWIIGIRLAYAYRQAIYISQENPEMTSGQALKASKKMMNGKKFNLFLFDLSFLGWALAVIITMGIASIYVTPYVQVANYGFYKESKK